MQPPLIPRADNPTEVDGPASTAQDNLVHDTTKNTDGEPPSSPIATTRSPAMNNPPTPHEIFHSLSQGMRDKLVEDYRKKREATPSPRSMPHPTTPQNNRSDRQPVKIDATKTQPDINDKDKATATPDSKITQQKSRLSKSTPATQQLSRTMKPNTTSEPHQRKPHPPNRSTYTLRNYGTVPTPGSKG